MAKPKFDPTKMSEEEILYWAMTTKKYMNLQEKNYIFQKIKSKI